ncbi:hypothetical protein AHMF7605_01915 [Adhaeribacter arboris]|uniref:STAS/SEC14 domain-containing protein n=1 Tax=Adhaeribacter arboris TaxID=2072846 RepID=A0A2T2YA26_9BACT|nr:hypothetical protein [Adhaeribacter arboris]PSR52365.1 hypothetical protein AHMF7605_01915 [Adhaeribacter arboris]
MIVFAINNMELEYHPEIKMVEVRCIGDFSVEDLALLWLKAVEVINKYEIECVLLDATHVAVRPEFTVDEDQVQQFFSENFPIPAVKKVARVCAGSNGYDERMANLYQRVLQQNDSMSAFANFGHHYEAMEWLMEKS